MKRQMRHIAVLVGILLLAALPGCGGGGEKKVKITGKLLKDGQPLVVSRETYVTLVFIPETETANEKTNTAKFNRATGAYEIELPAGKYRVNYIIAEKDKEPLQTPTEQKAKSYDLAEPQELNIDIK